jgi:hypothetical protein
MRLRCNAALERPLLDGQENDRDVPLVEIAHIYRCGQPKDLHANPVTSEF